MNLRTTRAVVVAFSLAIAASAAIAHAGIFQFTEDHPDYLKALVIAAAQEAEEAVDLTEKLTLDEEFSPKDFGLTSVGILPDSPFYFLKGIRRGVTSFFTFDPVNKAELRLEHAAEKLLETTTLADKEGVNPGVVTAAVDRFEGELNRVETQVARAATGITDEQRATLSDQVMNSVVKFGKTLGKLERDLPPEEFENVRQAKDRTMETFNAVFDLVPPEEASERLAHILDEQKGSEFKDFKNIEILKEVGEKVPDEAKAAIQRAEENSSLKLQTALEQFDTAERAVFEDFVRSIGGSEVRHLEILSDLEVRPLSEDLRKSLLSAKEEALTKTETRLAAFVDDDARERYLDHLRDGDFEDIRLLRELSQNVKSGILEGLARVKADTETRFVERVQETGTDEKKHAELLGSVDRYHDAKSLAVLDEIEALIPSDKKEFFSSLKSRAVENIKADISYARDEGERSRVYKALASDHPEDFRVIDRLGDIIATGIAEGIRRAQLDRFEERVAIIRDEDRLAKFETEFEGQADFIRSDARYRLIENIFSTKREILGSPEKAFTKIQEAEYVINDLRALTDSLPFATGFEDGIGFDPTLTEVARIGEVASRKLETARVAGEYGDYVRAFETARGAEDIAKKGIELANGFKSGEKKIVEKRTATHPENGIFEVYSPYEFGELCFSMRGYLRGPQTCTFAGGKVISVPQGGFPYKVSIADFSCGGALGVSCPAGYRCETPAGSADTFGQCVPEDKDTVTCQAYFEGFTYDSEKKTCYPQNATGCSNPFVYKTKTACEEGNLLRQKPLMCPAMSTVESCPAGERRIVAYSTPECGTYYRCEKATATSTDPGSYPGDENACPSFAYSRWDGTGKRYCQLNTERACSFSYPGYLDRANYRSSECPADRASGECRLNATKSACYAQPGCGWYAENGVNFCDRADYYNRAFTCNNNNSCESNENRENCPSDCAGTTGGSIWKKKIWSFSDGLSVESMILDRTDAEYANYLAPIQAQCLTIPKAKFSWKQNAGDDRPENWRNFGIPDCSGTVVNYVCGNNTCDPGETASYCPADCGGGGGMGGMRKCFYPSASRDGKHVGYTVWCEADYYNCRVGDPSGSVVSLGNLSLGAPNSCESWGGGSSCNTNGMCEGSETYQSCPADCGGTGMKTQCSDGYDNDGDGLIDYPKDSGCGSASDTTEVPDGATPTDADEICADGIDNDSDGMMDGADQGGCRQPGSPTSCSSASSCPTYRMCTNANFFWCVNDKYCYSSSTSCPGTASGIEFCGDGIDNDKDGFIDAADSECKGGSCLAQTTESTCKSAGSQCRWYVKQTGPSYCDDSAHTPSGTSCNNDETCNSTETMSFCPNDCKASGSTESCATTPASCTSQSQCNSYGFYWCNNACYQTNATCGGGGGGAASCNANGVCESNESYTSCPADCGGGGGGGSCSNTSSLCTTQSSCQQYNFYWCTNSNTCVSSSSACSGASCSSPGSCYSSSACAASGYYWCPSTSLCYGSSSECGSNTASCNANGVCEINESYTSCPADCGGGGGGMCNANSVCDSGETAASCPADCH